MYRRTYGARSAGFTSFHNRDVVARSRRHSAASISDRSRHYGPRRRNRSRRERDRNYWNWFFIDFAADDEKKEKESKEKEEEKRVPDEEVEKLTVLTVKNIDLHFAVNTKAHHTNKFDITKKINGEDAQLVLRRGQEFEVTVTFNRSYNKEKDNLIFVFDADDENPGKNLKERFKLDEYGTDDYRKHDEWGARILKMDKVTNTVKMAVYVSGDCVVGEWEMKVKTKLQGEKEDFVYVCPQPVIILFNPWSKDDQVYLEEEVLLKEYILNPSGTVYSGCSRSIGSRPWTYGQFDKGILPISLAILRRAFGFKMTPKMSDPIATSRALSKIINDCGDNGVLVGNWSGDYEGGESPNKWINSTAILREYEKTGKPVKFGQCWVFSHLLTAVCRALGLPCRSVTNFDSAHDSDTTCTIDCYYDNDANELNDLKTDSIWNFHVWNEVWIMRPDLKEFGDFNGWHVVDATPQEQSDGIYQCGPCPVKAVKKGIVNLGYDTGFVFGEVNADIIHWVVSDDNDVESMTVSSILKKNVGTNISTKVPNGKPHGKSLNWWNQNETELRYDLTNEYKYEEGTEDEREAVRRAVRYNRHSGKLYKESADLSVWFDTSTQTMVGKDLKVTAFVKNCTKEDREVEMLMSARTCTYWNHSEADKPLGKEVSKPRNIAAGKQESFDLTVKYESYISNCDESLCVYVYARAKDLKHSMPYSAQEPFRLRWPDMEFDGPEKAESCETVTVVAHFKNPLDVPLTQCNLTMQGGVNPAADDKNNFESSLWTYTLGLDDVPAGGEWKLTLRMCGELFEDEEDGDFKTEEFSFDCKELATTITGCFPLELSAHHDH